MLLLKREIAVITLFYDAILIKILLALGYVCVMVFLQVCILIWNFNANIG